MSDKRQPLPERAMAYLDGALSEEQTRAFEAELDAHPEWRDELAEMGALRDALDGLQMKPAPPEIWDNYWEEIDERTTRRTGWLALAAGGGILAAYAVVKILLLAENFWVRVSLGMLLAGFAILFVGVLRAHLLERPRDRYRKIKK